MTERKSRVGAEPRASVRTATTVEAGVREQLYAHVRGEHRVRLRTASRRCHFASVFLEEGGIAEALLSFVARCRDIPGRGCRGAHFEVRTKLFVEVVI